MNKLILTAFFFTALIVFACKENSTNTTNNNITLNSTTINDLKADTNSTHTATYFSFKDSSSVPASDSGSTNWDIAFYQTTIFVNSGVRGPGNAGILVLRNQDFKSLTDAPANGYVPDTSWVTHALPTGSGNGWYNYDPTRHLILAIPGVVLVFKTADGKYAKMRMINYYKGNPPLQNLNDSSVARYFTFEYVYQPNGSTKF